MYTGLIVGKLIITPMVLNNKNDFLGKNKNVYESYAKNTLPKKHYFLWITATRYYNIA